MHLQSPRGPLLAVNPLVVEGSYGPRLKQVAKAETVHHLGMCQGCPESRRNTLIGVDRIEYRWEAVYCTVFGERSGGGTFITLAPTGLIRLVFFYSYLTIVR